jgi:hypothetical protein
MGSSLRVRRVFAVSAVLLGVGALAACTPKPAAPPPPAPAVVNPPAPTTTTLPPPSAHLTISPTSTSLSTEATYDVSQTQTFTVTNDGNATSGPVVIDLAGLLNANIDWRITFDVCQPNTLAPGASCAFNLEPHVKTYWPSTSGPANLVVSAGPGVSATASVSGSLTSDLQVPSSNTPLLLTSNVAPGSATATFHVDNVSDQAVGPVGYSVTPQPGGVGTWALQTSTGPHPCVANAVIPAHSGCDWDLVYSNNTGAGSSVGLVTIKGDDKSFAAGAALGFGAP